MPAFERVHHQRIARVLDSLDGPLLRAGHCWFAGGTAIALGHGEYRESVDIDFMVSDRDGYRDLRHRMVGARDLKPITQTDRDPFMLEREARADQYGIRMFVIVDRIPIKLEVVREGRIQFDLPGRADRVCGVATLSRVDMAASKLLANSDRGSDRSAFSRDALDLAVLDVPPRLLDLALCKASSAYGDAVARDLEQAVDALRGDPDRLHHCMQALSIQLPAAAMQQSLRQLARRLDRCVNASSG